MPLWKEMQKAEDCPKDTYVLALVEQDFQENAYEVMTEFFLIGVVRNGEVIPDYGPILPIKGWWSLPKKEDNYV